MHQCSPRRRPGLWEAEYKHHQLSNGTDFWCNCERWWVAKAIGLWPSWSTVDLELISCASDDSSTHRTHQQRTLLLCPKDRQSVASATRPRPRTDTHSPNTKRRRRRRVTADSTDSHPNYSIISRSHLNLPSEPFSSHSALFTTLLTAVCPAQKCAKVSELHNCS